MPRHFIQLALPHSQPGRNACATPCQESLRVTGSHLAQYAYRAFRREQGDCGGSRHEEVNRRHSFASWLA